MKIDIAVKFLRRYSIPILTGVSAAGVFVSSALFYKAGKEIAALDDRKDEMDEKAVARERLKILLPPLAVAAVTGAAAITSGVVGVRRIASLGEAAVAADMAHRVYKDSVEKHLGKKQSEEAAQERAEKAFEKSDLTSQLGPGQSYFVESWTGQCFVSDVESVRRAVNNYNQEMLCASFGTPLSFFLNELGLRDCLIGEDYGWNAERPLEIRLIPHKIDESSVGFLIEYVDCPFIYYDR